MSEAMCTLVLAVLEVKVPTILEGTQLFKIAHKKSGFTLCKRKGRLTALKKALHP